MVRAGRDEGQGDRHGTNRQPESGHHHQPNRQNQRPERDNRTARRQPSSTVGRTQPSTSKCPSSGIDSAAEPVAKYASATRCNAS